MRLSHLDNLIFLNSFYIVDRVKKTVLNSARDKNKFGRFYLGSAGRKERRDLFRSEESEKLLKWEWENYQEVKEHAGPLDKEALLQKIHEQISAKDISSGKSIEMPFLRKYAAILIFGLVFGSGVVYWMARKPVLVEVYGSVEGNTDLLLPDGSLVTLNSNSTLTYPEAFSRKNRRVSLSGEAYFEVEHEETLPFIVHTSKVDIEVLGTTFSVKANPDDESIETILLTGKVRITRMNPNTRKSQSVILTPNHKAVFINKQEKFVLDKVDVESETAWKIKSLRFDNELLEELVQELGNRYSAKISISEDVLESHRITMTIDDESLEEVLTILTKTLALDYKRIDGEYIIYPSR